MSQEPLSAKASSWSLLIGPATFVYLFTLTVGGIWKASEVSSRLDANETQVRQMAAAAEKIVRLETKMDNIETQLGRIDLKMDRIPR